MPKVAMGRSPCCDNPGIKKGPWAPEEDIVLFSYIQQHGPGNWRSVPINTGLLRCSKSCRLRWTNYLRPGIKRGRFTPLEEGIIVHLQALIGNRWATIASYLPERTDNDIKNYWNTHLKKKLKKIHDSFRHNNGGAAINSGDLSLPNGHASFFYSPAITIENRTSNQNLTVFESSSSYASSADNISRLLQGWIHSSSKPETNNSCSFSFNSNDHGNFINYVGLESLGCLPEKLTWPEKPPAVDGRSSSLKFLENWLLEDTAGVQFDGLVEELPTELVQI